MSRSNRRRGLGVPDVADADEVLNDLKENNYFTFTN